MNRLAIAGVTVAAAVAAPAALAAGRWQVDSFTQPGGVDFTGFNGAFVASPTQAWAVGMQRQSNSFNFTQLIESWNRSRWSMSTGASIPGATLTELLAAGGSGASDVWAVGEQNGANSTLIEHFNGQSWTDESSPAIADGFLDAVSADSPSDAWAVGGQFVAEPHNSFTTSLTEHWNGSTWQEVSNPFGTTANGTTDTLVSIVAISPSDAWAIGVSRPPGYGGGRTTVLENWNGSTWTIVSQPVTGAILNSLSATGPNDVWAVGTDGLIEHFDGVAWSQVANPAGQSEDLTGVAALSSTDAWAVSSDGSLTEQWNGTDWDAVATAAGLPAGFVLGGVSGRSGGPLFAVGTNDGGGNNLSTILQETQP